MIRKRKYDKNRWMMNRERFRLTDPEPLPENAGVSICDVIGTIFKRIDANNQSWLRELEQDWPELMGPMAARHARPGRLDRQTLVIHVDSAVWLNELIRYERAGILARLQKRFGPDRVKSIRLQAEPDV